MDDLEDPIGNGIPAPVWVLIYGFAALLMFILGWAIGSLDIGWLVFF